MSLLLFALALCAPQAETQETKLPNLGVEVPPQVLRARIHSQQCLTDINHNDPCASVRIERMLFTIAWDTHTKEITYLFTSDHRFLTDSELGVGGHARLVNERGKPFDLVKYMNWPVTPQTGKAESLQLLCQHKPRRNSHLKSPSENRIEALNGPHYTPDCPTSAVTTPPSKDNWRKQDIP